jgi:hypothetical protein
MVSLIVSVNRYLNHRDYDASSFCAFSFFLNDGSMLLCVNYVDCNYDYDCDYARAYWNVYPHLSRSYRLVFLHVDRCGHTVKVSATACDLCANGADSHYRDDSRRRLDQIAA